MPIENGERIENFKRGKKREKMKLFSGRIKEKFNNRERERDLDSPIQYKRL